MSDGRTYIADAWQRFERMVVPASAGAVQRAETRAAFFAGAAFLFRQLSPSRTCR